MGRTKICDFPIYAIEWSAELASISAQTKRKDLGVLRHFNYHGVVACGKIELSVEVI